MNRFFFVPSVLQLFSGGTFFRKLFFYFFRASAALTALVGLVLCAGLLKIVINLPAVGVIGGFIFMALTIVAFYAAAHIYWIRAEDIRHLSETKFTMIPIARSWCERLARYSHVSSPSCRWAAASFSSLLRKKPVGCCRASCPWDHCRC